MAELIGCTKAELLDRMSSWEISEWICEFKLRRKDEEEANKKNKGKKR